MYRQYHSKLKIQRFGSKIGTNSHQDKIESKFKKHFIHLNISLYFQVNLETYCSKLSG